MAEKIEEELRLECRRKRFLEEYDLNLLYEVSDIDDGINELKTIVESYENIHISLKLELKEDYVATYPDYEQNVKVMTDWIKNARKEIRKKKKEIHEKLENEKAEETERLANKFKDKLRSEEKYFRGRIIQEVLNMYNESSLFVDQLEENVRLAQELKNGYLEIFVKIEELGDVEFPKEFGSVTMKNVIGLICL